MSRVQLALNVDDVDAAVDFYAKLFNAQPAKRRPGYANFALDEPALKLVLLENPGRGGSINHLGVEVTSTDEVDAAQRRLAEHGLATVDERATTCCYAVQDKFWVQGSPNGERWEIYTVLADAGVELEGKASTTDATEASNDGTCCTTSSAADSAQAEEDRATAVCCS